MLSETIFSYILVFIVLELYEIQWQKSPTMMGMLTRMYQRYYKSIFLFFLMHPTFYFSIFLMLFSDYNIYATSIFVIKVIDISMKILFIKKIFIDKEMSQEITMALLSPIPRFLPYLGVIVYPVLIFLALS